MRVANELAPFRLFAADALGERRRRAGERLEILRVEKVLTDLGIGKYGADLGIDFLDHLGRNAGTSGRSAMRCSAPTPTILTVPALTCGMAVPAETNINWMCPAMTSSSAGVAPL